MKKCLSALTDGLSISRNSVPNAENDVTDWVNGLRLAVN